MVKCNGLSVQNATTSLTSERWFFAEVIEHLVFTQEVMGSSQIRALTYFCFSLTLLPLLFHLDTDLFPEVTLVLI